jgi:hypothetical protein
MEIGRAGGDQAGDAGDGAGIECLLRLRRIADNQHQAEGGRREYAADERQQQQDRGESHPPLGRKEQRKCPGGRGNREWGNEAGTLADPLRNREPE